jgi:hypothetical protein
MSASAWDEMLAEFRALGGTADNIRLGEGAYGRGLFAIDPARPVAIHIPENLLIATADAEFGNGTFRVAAASKAGAREKAFLESYENLFSWRGGRGETEQVFEQAQALPEELRGALMSEYHCGDWFREPTDALVQERFLAARCIRYRDRNVIMPIVEMANHGSDNIFAIKDGVGLGGVHSGEVLVKYADFDAHGMFMIFGFAADQGQAFSIALGGKVGQSPLHVGRDLGNLSPASQVWVPQFSKAGGVAKLQFLMIGNRRHPRSCKAIFYKLMRDAGYSGFDDAFETMQHANRLHFLKLWSAIEDIESPMARTLRRMVRFQLQAMSYCYGVQAM